MYVAFSNLGVCQDCAMLIANGEGTEEHAALMVDCWGDLAMGLVLACTNCDEECDTFSTAPCDGCGSNLAGSRHVAAVLVSE